MKAQIRAAVFSDTHGNPGRMLRAVGRCRPDVVIHLGDHDRDTAGLREAYPETALYTVRGNCDIASSAPDRDVVPLGPVRAFITHGHLYNVDWGLDSLVYAAQEENCSLALFGHTHRADSLEIGGVKLLNPGTAGQGRVLSWALVEVYDNGGITCEIREFED